MTRAEMSWLALVTLATLLLIEVPYVIAYAQEARGFVFTGMVWSPHDFTQYAAAMREGATTSSWLVHDHLTPEPHAPAFMYPLYVALGKLAWLLDLDVQAVYHGAEIAARAILLVVIYDLCGAIFPAVRQRRLAFVLIAFSSGLAFWLLLLAAISGISGLAITTEFSRPEVSSFLVLFTAPHLMLGLAFLLLAARWYLAAWSRPGLFPAVATGSAVVGLGLTNPFSLVTIVVVLAAHLGVMTIRRPFPPPMAVLSTVVALLVAAPFLVYNALAFAGDPFWGVVYGQQNVIPSPPAPVLALGLAPLLAFAVLGLPAFLREPTPERRLVILWILMSVVLVCIPAQIGFQRRFVFGVQPMLGLMAAVGLQSLMHMPLRGAAPSVALGHRVRRYLLFMALFVSTACFYGVVLQIVTRPAERAGQGGAFQPLALKEAGQWLARITEKEDVVLAGSLTGNYLAGKMPGRVFVGHPIGTLRYDEKLVAAERFYLGADDREGREFLALSKIRYVVYGPHERAAGAAPRDATLDLRPVYDTAEVKIYEVAGVDALRAAP